MIAEKPQAQHIIRTTNDRQMHCNGKMLLHYARWWLATVNGVYKNFATLAGATPVALKSVQSVLRRGDRQSKKGRAGLSVSRWARHTLTKPEEFCQHLSGFTQEEDDWRTHQL